MNTEFKDICDSILAKFPQTEAIYVFGSYADGTFRPGSDIDIAILSNDLSAMDMWKLSGELSRVLNKDVDIIDLRNVGRVLQFDVLWKGIRIYQKDEASIALEENKLLSLCNDYLEQTQELAEEIIRTGKVYE
jgi:predicted nucleotidyltransferase